MNVSYENMEDIHRMQNEAIKRVREMQKRAKMSLEYGSVGINALNSGDSSFKNLNEKENCNLSEHNEDLLHNNKTNKKYDKNKKQVSNLNYINEFFKEPEKCLILVLILLLSDENVDIKLIFALMYIML